MGILVEAMSSLLQVVSRCNIYEKLYFTHAHRLGQSLRGSMVDLYVAVLECLCSTRRHLDLGSKGWLLLC